MKQKVITHAQNIKKYLRTKFTYLRYHKQLALIFFAYFCMLGVSIYFIYQYEGLQSQKIQSNQSFYTHNFYIEKNNLPIEEEDEEILVFDFESDSSYQKYVDPQIPFTDIGYIPDNLRTPSLRYITDTRGDLRLQGEAATAFEELAEAFYNDIGEKVVAVSSYRSYERQRQIKAGGCPDHLCAKAGYSEHQGGLAVDVWSASTEAYWKSSPRLMRFFAWFKDNAHLYGYHNSYQNGVDIDGYAVEPWHWRYVGIELASYLHESSQTFAEYYYSLQRD